MTKIWKMHCGGKLGARVVVFDVISLLSTGNVDLFLQKPQFFSVCTQIKNCGGIKPNTVVGRTGF